MTIVSSVSAAIVTFYITSIIITNVRSRIRAVRLASLSQRDLLKQLHPVPLQEITALALSHLQSGEQTTHDPFTVWMMLGEARGVSHMIANTEIMIALASYIERWNPSDMQFEAARMRRDGVLFRRSAAHLSNSVITSNSLNISIYAHEVASTYYLMNERLRNAMNVDPHCAKIV